MNITIAQWHPYDTWRVIVDGQEKHKGLTLEEAKAIRKRLIEGNGRSAAPDPQDTQSGVCEACQL